MVIPSDLYQRIADWKGVESEYWAGVQLLHEFGELIGIRDADLIPLKKGITRHCCNADFVTMKLMELAKVSRQATVSSDTVSSEQEDTAVEGEITVVKRRRKK